MFREPDPLAEQVSQALLGMPVEILEEQGDWVRLRSPDTYTGWSLRSGLAETPAGWHEPWVEVVDLFANLRPRNDYRLAVAERAPIGTRLPRLSEAEKRVELLLPDGRRLWTEAVRVQPVTARPLRPAGAAAICRTARRFLGVPYLWGGCSADGLDCSGFVQLVMRLHGIPLLRDADLQFRQGEPAPEPDATDLVFFGPTDRPERITHVGMMLDRRRFIHARGSDRVRIDLLAEEPHAGMFRGARRFLRRKG